MLQQYRQAMAKSGRNQSSIAIICVLLAALIVTDAEAWVARGIFHSDAHPNKCKITSEIILSPGETAKIPDRCELVTCRSPDGYADLEGCGAIAPPINCEWGDYINVNAQFPLCCQQRLICNESSADDSTIASFQDNLFNILRGSVNPPEQYSD